MEFGKKEDKPDLAILIASKIKEKKSEESSSKSSEGYKELAGMIKKDLESDDVEKFAKDLKSFIKMCIDE